jgi:hypothetical protein
MIQFMVKHGRQVALGIALLLAVIGAYAWLATGRMDCLVGGLLLAVGGYFFLRIFAEILEVIAETLLPR